MKEILMEMVQDRVDEKVSEAEIARERKTTVEHLRNLMETLGVTLEKAMDSIKIPQDDREMYANLVMKK